MTETEHLLSKPCLTITETSTVMGWSDQTIRRRIKDHTIQALPRKNEKQKLLISTNSIKKYLNIED